MKIAPVAFVAAIAAVLLLALAGPGTRIGLWEYGTGLLMMRWALFVGVGAALLALVLLIIPKTRHGRSTTLGAALILGLAAAWVPWSGYQTVKSLPFIHDITTDTNNPPAFVDVIPLRAAATNPVEYPGEETASQQRNAYPDIQPLELEQSAQSSFDQAMQAMRKLGWSVVAVDAANGRIEATDTTFWFGFKDDVVIRIVPTATGSRLDIRSKSRVGRSDVGANAARIRAFLAEFSG